MNKRIILPVVATIGELEFRENLEVSPEQWESTVASAAEEVQYDIDEMADADDDFDIDPQGPCSGYIDCSGRSHEASAEHARIAVHMQDRLVSMQSIVLWLGAAEELRQLMIKDLEEGGGTDLKEYTMLRQITDAESAMEEFSEDGKEPVILLVDEYPEILLRAIAERITFPDPKEE